MLLKTICLSGFVLLAGCGAADESGAEKLRASSSNGGSIVGNGLVKYSNEKLQLNFEYPSEWALSESESREEVVLSNSPLLPALPPSIVTFKRIKELGGKRIFDLTELKAALDKMYPKENWKPAEFVGRRRGFVARNIDKPSRITRAQYFVLDENYNILHVTYSANPEFGGEDIIYSVIGSVVIDLDPPELFDISIVPAHARPGDEVTVTIVAIDDASGIDTAYFTPPLVDLSNMEQNWLGYQLKHYPFDVYLPGKYNSPEAPWMKSSVVGMKRGYEPAAAFPFRSGWERITKVRYLYRFRLPLAAPSGRVVLANISLRDFRGNGVVYTLEPATDEKKIIPTAYLANYETRRMAVSGKPFRTNTALKAASFEVTGGVEPAGSGIEVKDLFWDSSVLPVSKWGTTSTALYARVDARADIVAAFTDVPKILGASCVVSEYSWDSFLSDLPSLGGTRPVLSSAGHSLLRMERLIDPGQPQCDGSFRSSTAFLRRLYLRDELGNLVSLSQAMPNSYERGDLQLPQLKKPVLFQMTW